MKRNVILILLFAVLVAGARQIPIFRPPYRASAAAALDVGNPVVWYKMAGTGDTNTTQILDSSGNAYHASNRPAVATGPVLITGDGNAYYNFVAASNMFFIGKDDAKFSPALMTVSAWVYLPAHDATYKQIVTKAGGAGLYEWWISIYASSDTRSNQFAYTVTDENFANYRVNFTGQIFPVGSWVFVCATYSAANTQALWINATNSTGTPVTSGSFAGFTDTTAPMCVGAWASAANFWNGYIDDVRYFTNVLTGAQITNLYTAGRQ